MNLDFLYNKYKEEVFENSYGGLYSGFDSRILYSIIREYKPKNIIEFGLYHGRTHSIIISGLRKNFHENGEKSKYIGYEKDIELQEKIKNISKKYDFVDCSIENNIIENKIDFKIDLLFIDANHDWFLCNWYIKNLFPKVSKNGMIHIHDLYFNKNGNAFEDITSKHSPCGHVDITSKPKLENFYPNLNIKDEFVGKTEGDRIFDFFKNNKISYYSTLEAGKRMGQHDKFNCSFWFQII